MFILMVIIGLLSFKFAYGAVIENSSFLINNSSFFIDNNTNSISNNSVNLSLQNLSKIKINSNANLSVVLNDVIYTNIEYTKLFRIDNLLYPQQKIDVIVNYSISGKNFLKTGSFIVNEVNKYKTSNTGKILFKFEGNYTLCGEINNSGVMVCKNIIVLDLSTIKCDPNLKLEIVKNNGVLNENNLLSNHFLTYQDDDKLKLNFNVNSTQPFIIEYWINDVFEAKIKQKLNTSLPKKQYTINNGKEIDILFIKAILYPICNDTNLLNNNISKQLIIVNNKNNSNLINSHIEFIKVYNENKLKFGGNIRIKAKIIKKNSSKNSLQAYVVDKNNKKVSEITKISLFGKGFIQDILLYVKLKEKCDVSKSSKHYVVLEGFDVEAKKAISIDCDEKKNLKKNIEKNKKKKKTKLENVESKNLCGSQENNKNNSSINSLLNLKKFKENTTLYLNKLNDNELALDFNSSCDVYGGIIYQNKNSQIRSFTKFFLGLLLLLNIVVIFFKK